MTDRTLFAACLLFAAPLFAEPEYSVWDGVFTAQQANAGAKLFVEHCVACHSSKPGEMSGHGPAPAVIGADFAFRWQDASVAELYESIRQTMPEGAPNSLSVAQYGALTAYVLQLNGYPAGDKNLDASQDYQRLDSTWIESKAPH